MRLIALGKELEFISVELVLHRTGIKDLFALKNNKTLAETLTSRKYFQLASQVHQRYPDSLREKLGEFVYRLKLNDDKFYLKFLNKYGDRTYCDFSITDHLKSKGLYSYLVNGKIKYIGRSHDPLGKRINHGYGHISPKNCYRDGRATNCHLNSLIAEYWQHVSFYVCLLENDIEIDLLEKALIKQLQPEWNIALKS